jgi:general secretion pathway protein C
MQLRFSQIHVTILNFVLVAALAIVSAMCVRDVIARSVSNGEDTPAAAAFAPKAAAGPRTRASYDEIVKRDIFNETPQASGPAPVVEADLNLKLIGTSLASKSRPYAIIEDPAGNESLYQVGEDIPNAGKLVNVEVNRAIIDRNGHRVALEIPTSDMPAAPPSDLGGMIGRLPAFRGIPGAIRRRLQGGGGPIRTNKGGDDSDDNDNNDSSADDNSSAKVQLKKLGPGQYEASRAEVQQSIENPTQFFTQMRAMPHFVDGKTDGFAISQVAPGSVFDQLGLQNGDLLTSINGQLITNPMQALTLMQAMKTAPAIDLVVNRGGAPTSVHLTLR